MKKTKVAVIFGSKSVEHEVSVVTAMQIMVNLDKKKYEIIPVYIDKTGKWWSGKALLKLENYKNLELKNKIGLGQYSLLTTGEKKLIPVGGVMRKAIDFDIALAAVHGLLVKTGLCKDYWKWLVRLILVAE
jgi:D-alanine-D-alanine ligase